MYVMREGWSRRKTGFVYMMVMAVGRWAGLVLQADVKSWYRWL
jgi:hypothetical protein